MMPFEMMFPRCQAAQAGLQQENWPLLPVLLQFEFEVVTSRYDVCRLHRHTIGEFPGKLDCQL